MNPVSRFTRVSLIFAAVGLAVTVTAESAGAAPRWFKGNLHTHSLWSDGDDYPEMIADWYKGNGYHFLALSDHNVMQQGTRWLELKQPVSIGGDVVQRGGGAVLEKYLRRFGPDWVEQREVQGRREVRLKPLAEYRSLFEEPGRFLMIPAEEISANWKREKTATEPEAGGPVHVNAINLRELVPPIQGDNAVAVMQQVIDAVLEQRERTGQPMIPHLNHPNFRWAITAEELAQVRNERFFEVYNGHPGVNNGGDATRLGTDAMWDAILALRLTELNLGVMYGIGTDDAHAYHTVEIGKSNPGRGWIMVRASHLTAESILQAMEAGDFYASTGVTLRDVQRKDGKLSVDIEPEPGVTYLTQFIGTRRGWDRATQVMETAFEEGARRTLNHRRYSADVGAVLAEVPGTSASYTLQGGELYVRAKIISSKPKPNASVAGEFEVAWTQPLVNP